MRVEAEPPITLTVHALAAGATSAAEMRAWKALVADAAASGAPLMLEFFGGANSITAYRLFYMLVHAKEAGVSRVSLCTDGVFIDEEASGWLAESGVDEIVIRKRPA